MSQNSVRISWTEEELQAKLRDIMHDIHDKCVEYGVSQVLDFIRFRVLAICLRFRRLLCTRRSQHVRSVLPTGIKVVGIMFTNQSSVYSVYSRRHDQLSIAELWSNVPERLEEFGTRTLATA